MKKRVGILTSGGDCPGLNATLRGVAKALYQRLGEDHVEIIGISNGYSGLINGDWRVMQPNEFSGILTVGGTILGTKRTPFKLMRVVGEDHIDKVEAMKKNYAEMKLDCLLCLGGNGTHKTANLLSEEGAEHHRPAQNHRQRHLRHRRDLRLPLRHGDCHRGHRPGAHHRRQPQPLHGGGAHGQQGRLAYPLRGHRRRGGHHPHPELPYSIENVCAAIEKRAARASASPFWRWPRGSTT